MVLQHHLGILLLEIDTRSKALQRKVVKEDFQICSVVLRVVQ